MGSAVAERRFGLGVALDVVVRDFKGVVAESPELVAAHRARAGRGRGGVEEEVHAPVVVKVGEEELLRVGELDARVAARVAREARVGLLGEAPVVIKLVGFVVARVRVVDGLRGLRRRLVVVIRQFGGGVRPIVRRLPTSHAFQATTVYWVNVLATELIPPVANPAPIGAPQSATAKRHFVGDAVVHVVKRSRSFALAARVVCVQKASAVLRLVPKASRAGVVVVARRATRALLTGALVRAWVPRGCARRRRRRWKRRRARRRRRLGLRRKRRRKGRRRRIGRRRGEGPGRQR